MRTRWRARENVVRRRASDGTSKPLTIDVGQVRRQSGQWANATGPLLLRRRDRPLLVNVLLHCQALDEALHAGLSDVRSTGQRQLHVLGGLGVVTLAASDTSHAGIGQPVVGIFLLHRAKDGKRFVLLLLALELARVAIQLPRVAHGQ